MVWHPSSQMQHPDCANDRMNEAAMQSEEPKQFTDAQRQETKEWLKNRERIAKEAKEDAMQKAVRRRAIRTRRQQLQEAKAKHCTDARKGEIEQELSDLKGLEEQLCGRCEPKHPSSRPSAEKLGFTTDSQQWPRSWKRRRFSNCCAQRSLLQTSSA